MKQNNLFIYLARRDKKGIKVISAFAFDGKAHATRVNDIASLGLSPQIMAKVSEAMFENRMDYELFAESAPSFDALRSSLERRGYSHLPLQQFTGYANSTRINKKSLVTQTSTMLRRGSETKK